MCTVTFVRSGQKAIITSNRDEDPLRAALPPQAYCINGMQLHFPKDPLAGGTWFAVSESNGVGVLLNGAFQKHKRHLHYRRSRGLILLDVLSDQTSPVNCWNKIVLHDVEPFTIILYANGQLCQLTWDGTQKHRIELDPEDNHIWSSATLYNEVQTSDRKKWFQDFISNSSSPDEQSILGFHNSHSDNSEYGFVMDRKFVKTVSITQAIIAEGKTRLQYFDLQAESVQTIAQ